MTKTAEQVLQEHYGKHGQCTIQQAKFVRWEDAINAMEAYAAQRPTVAPSPTKEIIPASLCPECNPQWRTMTLHRQAADILQCEHCGSGLEREVWKHYHKNGGKPFMLKLTPEQATPVAEGKGEWKAAVEKEALNVAEDACFDRNDFRRVIYERFKWGAKFAAEYLEQQGAEWAHKHFEQQVTALQAENQRLREQLNKRYNP